MQQVYQWYCLVMPVQFYSRDYRVFMGVLVEPYMFPWPTIRRQLILLFNSYIQKILFVNSFSCEINATLPKLCNLFLIYREWSVWYQPSFDDLYTCYSIALRTNCHGRCCYDYIIACAKGDVSLIWFYDDRVELLRSMADVFHGRRRTLFNTNCCITWRSRQNGRKFADDIIVTFSWTKPILAWSKFRWSLFPCTQLSVSQHGLRQWLREPSEYWPTFTYPYGITGPTRNLSLPEVNLGLSMICVLQKGWQCHIFFNGNICKCNLDCSICDKFNAVSGTLKPCLLDKCIYQFLKQHFTYANRIRHESCLSLIDIH